MSEEIKPQDELELQAGDKKLRVRGSDILGIATLCVVCLIAYGGWEHKADAANQTAQLVSAIKESVQQQKEMVNSQREANCLARLDPKNRRDADVEFCRQLGRGR